MKLFLDIETVPDHTIPEEIRPIPALGNLKDQDKIDAKIEEFKQSGQIKAMSVDPMQNKIACIQGFIEDDYIDFPIDERQALEKFWEIVGMKTIVGHNVFNFDIPTIVNRSMILGVKPSRAIILKRYSKTPVFDTMEVLAGWDRSKWKSLDWYCQRFGIGKKNNDASNVYELYNAGQHEEIKAYCRNDVEMTRALYEKIKNYYA